MKFQDILKLRLYNQHISHQGFKNPAEIVQWLGALQAQDYAGAKWSVGLRLAGSKETDVEHAIADRSIIRTWPMRGTLHFVAAEDVVWMLKLLTPRIIAKMAGRNRQLELDSSTFNKSHDLLLKEMEGGRQLMRNEVYEIFERNGIFTSGQRGIHIINYLAQKQLICHGFHNDKQPTYVLLDEWVTKSKELEGDEALAEIAYRYFASHGPATIQDFAWWTELKLSDARKGLEAISHKLLSTEVDSIKFWCTPELPDKLPAKKVHLLPGFDEYMLGYTNRSLMVDLEHMPKIVPGNNGMFMPTIVVNGKVEGLWKRTLKKDKVIIDVIPFDNFGTKTMEQIETAVLKYGKYIGRETHFSS